MARLVEATCLEVCAYIAQSGHGAFMQGMGSIDSPTHPQEDCVESGLGTLKLLAQLTVLLL
eukprot:1137276-Pelagomonas_calceolata.AAC.2